MNLSLEDLLICTMISENQGLEKLRSVPNLHTWIFFSLSPYGTDLALTLGGDLEKKSRFAGPDIFLRFEVDLDFSRP